MKDKLRPQCERQRGWGGRGGLPSGSGGADRDGNTRAPGSICAPTQSPVAPQSRGSCQALGEHGRRQEPPGTLAGQKPRSGQGARLRHPPKDTGLSALPFPVDGRSRTGLIAVGFRGTGICPSPMAGEQHPYWCCGGEPGEPGKVGDKTCSSLRLWNTTIAQFYLARDQK